MISTHGVPPTVKFDMPMGAMKKKGSLLKPPQPMRLKTQTKQTTPPGPPAEPSPKKRTSTPSASPRTRRSTMERGVRTQLGAGLSAKPSVEMPPPVLRGQGGRYTSNAAYQQAIKSRVAWNTNMTEQNLLQGRQFTETMPVPKSRRRPEGYERPKTKAQMAKIQAEAMRIDKARTQNIQNMRIGAHTPRQS